MVRRGKGRRDRQVPVQPEVSSLLLAYLAETARRLGDPGPLFRSHDRGHHLREQARLSTRAIGYLVRQAMGKAGLAAKAISPHALRHTYAIRALRAGGNVIAVPKLLGHASVATTQRYLDHGSRRTSRRRAATAHELSVLIGMVCLPAASTRHPQPAEAGALLTPFPSWIRAAARRESRANPEPLPEPPSNP